MGREKELQPSHILPLPALPPPPNLSVLGIPCGICQACSQKYSRVFFLNILVAEKRYLPMEDVNASAT